MGRESHDPTHVAQSSIALLQERFKQLQRAKEMREERELLRILSEPNSNNIIINKQCLNDILNNPTMNHDPSSRLVFHYDSHHHQHLIFPEISTSPSSTPQPQVALSLWPTLQSYCSSSFEDRYCISADIDQTPLVMKLWPLDTPEASSVSDKSRSLDSDPNEYYSDVDTSLHL